MDTTIALWIHGLIPQQGLFGSILIFLSTFGSTEFIFFFVVFLAMLLALSGRFNKAHMIVIAAVLSSIAITSIKWIIKRPRPELWVRPIEDGYSFPSGHALVTTAVFGLCAYLLAEAYPKFKRAIYAITAILVFAIGLSRIVIGVHYPSDVIGGWLIGSGLLYIFIWWYDHGGLKRTLRIIIGGFALLFGLIGLIIPIIPGIPLLIGGFLLIFSSKPLGDFFKQKEAPKNTSSYGDGKVIDITPNLDGNNKVNSGK